MRLLNIKHLLDRSAVKPEIHSYQMLFDRATKLTWCKTFNT